MSVYTKKNTAVIYEHNNIPEAGYEKVCLHLSKTTLKNADSGLNALSIENKIFDKLETATEESRMDSHRFQVNEIERFFKGKWWPNIKKRVQEQLDFIYPNLRMCHVSALRSLPGGPEQEMHCDFSYYDFPKFAGIISLSDNNTLEIKGKGKEPNTTLPILRSEVVIFRGDLMHAGSSYKEENKRIYFKAIPVGTDIREDEVNAVANGYLCEKSEGGCGLHFGFLLELYAHRHLCECWQSRKKKGKKRPAKEKGNVGNNKVACL